MSLINDALKRAKNSQQSDSPAGAPPLPPVEPEKPRDGSGGLFIVIIVLLIAAAGFLIGLAFTKRKPPVEVAAIAPPVTQVTQTIVAVVSTPPPIPAPQTSVVATPKPPAPPALKLQGIFYNGPQPQAIVNGTTVYVGDLVNGFRVKLIAQNYVSFTTPDGTEKTLTLPK